MPPPWPFILEYWFLTPVCVAAATVAMTVGIGGPVFFTPLFILVLDLPPATAIGAALFTQLFGFLSGTVAYWRRRLVDRKVARGLLAWTVPAAFVGSLLAGQIPGPLLRRLFGCVAIVVAYRIFRSGSQDRRPSGHPDSGPPTVLVDRSGTEYRYRAARPRERAAWSVVGATLLGMISVGLAELQGYHLIARSRIPPAVAVATNIVIVVAAVAAASVGHALSLSAGDNPSGFGPILPILAFSIPGVLVGGQLGPLVQARLRPELLTRATGVVLLCVGGVMLVT